ncbi:MAG: permease-like cell division protein FtsX [Chromatiales bacterium]|jgi:cell division transport system permease protein
MAKRAPKPQKTSRKKPAAPVAWLLRHAQVALASLGRLTRSPVATLMTATVIGIAAALPAGMWVLLNNVQQLSGSWDGAATISIFLKTDVSDAAAQELQQQLRKKPEISAVQLISKQQAMQEFRQQSGFGKALEVLDSNPLPAVLVVTPTLQHSDPANAELLVKQLDRLEQADFAQLDLEWVRRFHAITEIAARAVVVLASLLSLAVLLIIGNTIRLEIQNRHAEIEITKLIGATDAFIQRPFLYSGFWYGLAGGLIAWLLVSLSLWLLSGPVETLTGLYQSDFGLSLLGLQTSLILVLGTALLGILGARIAVGRHLSAIEPE